MEIQNDVLRKSARNYILQKYFCDLDPAQIITESESETYSVDKSGKPDMFYIRLNIKKLLSDFDIRLDAETGEVLNWCFSDYYKNASETVLTKEEALKIVFDKIQIPEDAVIEEFSQEKEKNSHITNITWSHYVNGLQVENDSIFIQINSKTKEVIAVSKIWNDVPEQIDRIDINRAKKIAEREAAKYISKKEFDITVIESKYIPIVRRDDSDKLYTKIVKVWQVSLREPANKFPPTTVLSIDCLKGEVIRVEHSK